MCAKKYINTPRGKFQIGETFESRELAIDNHYGYAFTHYEYDIYLKYHKENCCICALVPKGM